MCQSCRCRTLAHAHALQHIHRDQLVVRHWGLAALQRLARNECERKWLQRTQHTLSIYINRIIGCLWWCGCQIHVYLVDGGTIEITTTGATLEPLWHFTHFTLPDCWWWTWPFDVGNGHWVWGSHEKKRVPSEIFTNGKQPSLHAGYQIFVFHDGWKVWPELRPKKRAHIRYAPIKWPPNVSVCIFNFGMFLISHIDPCQQIIL